MILVLGKSGQVARALKNLAGMNVVCLGHDELDLAKPNDVRARLPGLLSKLKPSGLINAAAYTAVDRAEAESDLVFKINSESVGAIAETTQELNLPWIHISTDYVYGRNDDQWIKPGDSCKPLNVYGASKLAGDEAILRAGGSCIIVRTSWVYDDQSENFPNKMKKLLQERESLRVVNDQWGCPTHASDLAKYLLNLALKTSYQGVQITHFTSGGEPITWYTWCLKIKESLIASGIPESKLARVEPCRTEDFPTPAKRQKNSRLLCE